MSAWYQLRVRGRLGPAVAALFEGMEVESDGPHSVLRGSLVDQAALYGVIDRLEALGLDLIEVRTVPDP